MDKKKILLKISGFMAYVGTPIIPTAMFWDFFVSTDAKTTVSSVFMLVLFAGTTVFSLIFNKDKLPFKPNKLWIVLAVLCGGALLLQPIIEKVFVIACTGAGGSFAGSFLLKKADQITEAEEKEKDQNLLAEKVANQMSINKTEINTSE